MDWMAGDRVRNKPELAHLYDGTHWAEKLSKPRFGMVREVPKFTQEHGHGTLLIEWESLTDVRGDDKNWIRWMHSDHIERVAQ
ncbi:hypothetical protein [Roseovarius indicus]|uniref:Uncharacterized protein n=1 Tax=Roseovarius indicus TaxID=540747 RepID=A0A0T5P8P6_9RHOB|nr:hypothetical protein [Roseovarius indicus]KRS17504.1 hypothetical protein XM52_13560 [Roseovarius indicus]QEW26704.1 hypothetical protein RIdsm_02506 [Roseovarius indicus]SFD61371.1 hypothetical protein SAMN04488031_101836 [Roseovarius indicus]